MIDLAGKTVKAWHEWYGPWQYAIEFEDGTVLGLTSCGCCDGVVAEITE